MFSCLKVKLSSFLFVAFFHPIHIIKPGCAYGRLIKVLNCDIFCYKIHFIAAAFILFDEIRDILPSCHFEQDNAEKVIDRNIDCVQYLSLSTSRQCLPLHFSKNVKSKIVKVVGVAKGHAKSMTAIFRLLLSPPPSLPRSVQPIF